MAKKNEETEKEQREFQLEMLKVRIKTQYILSSLTLFLAILFSTMISLVTTYMNFFSTSGDINWAYTIMAILVLFPIAMFLMVRYYGGQGARIVEKGVQKELQNIRERFIDKKPVEKEETKKERKEKRENEKRKSMSKYEILAVFFAVLNIISTGFNLYLIVQTNQIHRESQEFQNMMYDFTPVIVANTDNAFLDSSQFSYSNGKLQQIIHYGYLDVNIQVVTPHYGNLTIKLKSFNVGDSEMLDSERRNDTKVTYAFENDVYEDIVIVGLNQIPKQLHLKASVYPNQEKLPPQGEPVQFPLGRLFLEAELYDIHTNTTLTKEFSARILAVLELP